MQLHRNPVQIIVNLLLLFRLSSIARAAVVPNRQEYAIGPHFTPNYAAVAVSYANGSNIALGRVSGDGAWHDLIFWLCVNPIYPGLDDEPLTTASQAILDKMIRSLVEVGAARLGEPIRAAAVSLAGQNQVHHYGESSIDAILKDAFRAAGIEYLQMLSRDAVMGEPLIFVEKSIVAGHGLCLCHPYTANQNCTNGTRPPPEDVYYLIGYYASELEITRTADYWTAYNSWWYGFPTRDLGRDFKHAHADDQQYWDKVRVQLLKSLLPRVSHNVTKLIYYGDFAEDAQLREVVAEVLHMLGQTPALIDDEVDPVYAGALGTAELAKRKPYHDVVPKHPGLIVQPKSDL
ncbi:hypothetical protein B0A48_00106 [Cryoendolithus antarcticus]|uniref:Uncharacterized protein n=1 Tax=Cryoendolithus antarcticus TaxID=1507870 RepID=A0A1V8TTK4_9PEZI|nr:hypothetical protein B0A48_00106 [Cryoendolithus antarcticus]